eukprot:gene55096-75491_t
MKNHRLILAAAALALPAAVYAAKKETPKTTKPQLIQKYDANKNGKLEADELEQIKSDFLADPRGDLRRSPVLARETPPDSASVASIRDKAHQSDSFAYDIVEGLTTEIGPRQGGTEAEARARTWAVSKLKALGFDNVRIEEYQMPTWVRGEETAAIVAPYTQKLAIAALGNSGSTSPSPVSVVD